MAVTLEALLHADTGRIREAAAGWEKIADELDATVEQMARGTGDLPNHWEGEAAEAAEQLNHTFQIEIGNIPHGFHVVARQLRDLAEKFEHCRQMVHAVVDDAKADGMRVDPRTGQISTTGPVTTDSVAAVQGIMDELARRLTQILAHRTDNPHADLFVRISEVDPAGRSRNVTEGYRRLDPDRDQNAPVRLPLLPIAHRFPAGSRIRVLIAGGSYPQYLRNLGTDENPGTGTKLVPSRHTIALGPSRVVLPRSG